MSLIPYLFDNTGMPGTQIEIGSIGWDDEDEFVSMGTDTNDGYTLVRVQLFRDRDTTKEINPKRAQGTRITCQLSGGIFRIPKKDTRCIVAIPRGMEELPGAPVIVATVEKSPSTQFAKDRAVLDYGDDVHVVIKGKSISLQDPDNRFLSVGTPRGGGAGGLTLQAKDGSGIVVQDSAVGLFAKDGAIIQITPTSIDLNIKGGSFCKLTATQYYTYGISNFVRGAGCYIGALPTVATPVLYGPVGPAGVASLSVFVSP